MATMTVAHDNVVDVVDARVRLAPGVELLGEYMDSGFSRPQYLLRRPDGRVVLVSHVLYLVASALLHHDRLGTVARVVGEQLGRPISAAYVDHLISTELRPAGVLAAYDDRLVVVPQADPPRRLSARFGAVPQRVQQALMSTLRPLFHLPVVANVVTAVVITDVWVATQSAALRDAWVHVASSTPLVLAMAGLLVASSAFHQLGRAGACRFGGGRPGPLSVGLDIVWPAVHADVSDAYRLGWRGRLRTHLGGVYADLVFGLLAAAGYVITGSELLLAAVILPQMHALWQVLPLARLDGYHLLSDVAGIPNLFAYLPAATATLLPVSRAARRRASHTLDALTQPARTALRAWVALAAGVLALLLAVAVYLAPRTLPELWRSTRATCERLATAAGDGRWTTTAGLTLQLAVLAVLALGGAALIGRAGLTVGRRVTAAGSSRGTGIRAVPRRAALPVLVVGAVLLAAVVGLAVSRLSPSDSPASRPLSAVTTTPSSHDPVPAPRPPTETTAGTTPAAAGPSEGGAHGPAAPLSTTAPAPAPAPGSVSTPPASTPPASPAAVPAPAPSSADPTPTQVPSGAAAVPAPSVATGPGWIVRPGDDLWSIAGVVQSQARGRLATEEETRSYWAQLLEANPASGDLLLSGQVLVLPAATSADTASTGGASQPASAATEAGAGGSGPAATWTVQPGDDLWTIAQHVEERAIGRAPTDQETAGYWTTLVAANRHTLADADDPDLLYSGQVLTIPTAAR